MFFFFFFFTDETNGNEKAVSYECAEWKDSANKGDWSELYTLYKLLVDQSLFPINKFQTKGERLRMPILSILRHTDKQRSAEYRIDDQGEIMINANGIETVELSRSELEKYTSILLDAIKSGNNSSFKIPELDEFRKKTFCPNIKCYSKRLENGNQDKSDLYIVIHDAVTGQTPKLGFSIKSEIGEPPTLFNASEQTNFRYRLSRNLPQEKIDYVNKMQSHGKTDIQGRVRFLLKEGISLDFETINPSKKGDNIFLENLLLVDSSMPEILARLLVMNYSEDTRLLNKLTDKLTESNPLKFPMRTNQKVYEAKVKRFVSDAALGLLPSQPWDANRRAAGVLVVTETGDVDCYHVIYQASLEDYLYNDLKFETPSASRHKFGSIEIGEDGNQYFSLNLQLRFLK